MEEMGIFFFKQRCCYCPDQGEVRGDRCGPRASEFPLVTRPASDDPLNLQQLLVWGEESLAPQTEPCSGVVEPLWAPCCRLSSGGGGRVLHKARPANLQDSGVLSAASLSSSSWSHIPVGLVLVLHSRSKDFRLPKAVHCLFPSSSQG